MNSKQVGSSNPGVEAARLEQAFQNFEKLFIAAGGEQHELSHPDGVVAAMFSVGKYVNVSDTLKHQKHVFVPKVEAIPSVLNTGACFAFLQRAVTPNEVFGEYLKGAYRPATFMELLLLRAVARVASWNVWSRQVGGPLSPILSLHQEDDIGVWGANSDRGAPAIEGDRLYLGKRDMATPLMPAIRYAVVATIPQAHLPTSVIEAKAKAILLLQEGISHCPKNVPPLLQEPPPTTPVSADNRPDWLKRAMRR
jgi:hypothetical protein